ncbi:hypothetical protein [Romboutsia sp.]|uniref:hypothetical protein n=1 Tax=Romboutsia sp. TaxID=1965302 RepID=UPI003F3CA4DA
MKSVDIKKVPKTTIILYSCATLMTLCTIFMIYKSNTYISGLVAQGFDPSKEFVEVINYYLVTVTPFVFYTISLFSLGYIVEKINHIIKIQNINVENNRYLDKEPKNIDKESENIDEDDKDEIDDFFK